MYQVLVEEIDYGDEDSVKQATDLLLQKELVSEVGGSSRGELRKQLFNLILQQVIQEHNVEQEIITAEDEFKIIEHADIAMDDNLGTSDLATLASIVSLTSTLTNIHHNFSVCEPVVEEVVETEAITLATADGQIVRVISKEQYER